MGSKVITGVNDLKTKCPNLALEWDYEKNAPFRPENVAYSSNKQFSWICSKGHSFVATPNSRTNKNSGCKYCSNKAVLKGFNDLSHTNPQIASEWDYEKNGTASPDNYSAGSDKKYYWICPNGHDSYLARIKQRTAGKGCPLCERTKAGENIAASAIKKRGSIAERYPTLLVEWDYENNDAGPECYSANSSKYVWWKCSWCSNSWRAKIETRTKMNSGCPKCNFRNKTSFPEQAVFFYLKILFPDAQNSFTEFFEKMELDIYIPSIQAGIEYDGIHWHGKSRSEKDREKYRLCHEQGITLYRIRESSEDASDICDEYVVREDFSSYESLDKAITIVLESILKRKIKEFIVDTKSDRNLISAQYYTTLRENSLEYKFPAIAREWHPQKNGDIRPDMVVACSQVKYWWICPDCGHEYEQRVSERTLKNRGCKKCSSLSKSQRMRIRNLVSGENDLVTLYPNLMKEWDYDKNTEFSPNTLTSGSKEEVAWICQKCGTHWVAAIQARTAGSGCPSCGRKKAGISKKQGSILKYGSLQSTYPEIAAQWDYEENNGVTPDQISPIDKSSEFHWICSCGTKWISNVYNLTHSKYVGCRKCRYKQAGQYRKDHPEANHSLGRHHSEETRRKISLAVKGERNYWFGKKGELNPNFGKTFTDDHKAKISQALKGRTVSDEMKEKLSRAKKGKKIGASHPESKPVRQLTMTGEFVAEYDSISSAESALGIIAKRTHIGDVCSGQRKSAYGYRWEWVSKE